MIDFAKITKTLDGMDCRYIHERESNGERVHVFALFNNAGERYEYYNQQGHRLKWTGSKWELEQDGKWKIYEPKIVEVTRWFVYDRNDSCLDGYYCFVNVSKPVDGKFDHVEKVTARFEVPND